MTKAELKQISLEREEISKRLTVLDPDNAIESQEIDRHLHRLDFLKYQIDCALVDIKRKKLKNRLRIIS